MEEKINVDYQKVSQNLSQKLSRLEYENSCLRTALEEQVEINKDLHSENLSLIEGNDSDGRRVTKKKNTE